MSDRDWADDEAENVLVSMQPGDSHDMFACQDCVSMAQARLATALRDAYRRGLEDAAKVAEAIDTEASWEVANAIRAKAK